MRFSVENRCPHPAVISGDSRSPATGILQEGGILSVTVTPDSGYVLDTLAVTGSRGNAVKLTGKGGGVLDPRGLATRAQAAEMLMNFLKK